MRIDLTEAELLWIRSKALCEAWQDGRAESVKPKVDEALKKIDEAVHLRERLAELES